MRVIDRFLHIEPCADIDQHCVGRGELARDIKGGREWDENLILVRILGSRAYEGLSERDLAILELVLGGLEGGIAAL